MKALILALPILITAAVAYLKSEAIKKGINPWQPTYGVPTTPTP